MTGGGRFVLGLTGPPGAGKSTIAAALAAALEPDAVVVPMDGFHLAQADLEHLGRASRKGAPDTFDVDGYVSLLASLRSNRPVEAPVFDRERENPVHGAIHVSTTHRIVVTEGNYLLGESGGWERVRPLLDQCWYVDVDPTTRVDRLIARHVRHGRTPAAAAEWVIRSDEANARLIESTRDRADRDVQNDNIGGLAAAIRDAAGQTR